MHLHIFLDLDHTLVNVFPLWQELWINELARHLEQDPKTVFACGAQIWERGDLYSLEGHLHALNIDPKQDWALKLQERFQDRLRAGVINYEDTAGFLDALSQHGITRSVLTFGDRAYQQLKVDGLGRPVSFFHGVHFTNVPGEKAFVLSQASRSDQVIFLDDSATEHAQVARLASHVHRIQIRRNNEVRHSEDAHHVVSSLPEALDVVLSMQPKNEEGT